MVGCRHGHDTVICLCLSICLSVTKLIVAEGYSKLVSQQLNTTLDLVSCMRCFLIRDILLYTGVFHVHAQSCYTRCSDNWINISAPLIQLLTEFTALFYAAACASGLL